MLEIYVIYWTKVWSWLFVFCGQNISSILLYCNNSDMDEHLVPGGWSDWHKVHLNMLSLHHNLIYSKLYTYHLAICFFEMCQMSMKNIVTRWVQYLCLEVGILLRFCIAGAFEAGIIPYLIYCGYCICSCG